MPVKYTIESFKKEVAFVLQTETVPYNTATEKQIADTALKTKVK